MNTVQDQYREAREADKKAREKRKLNDFPYLTCESATDFARHYMTKERKCNVVYWMYGANDELLYVGRTDCFAARWRQHLASDKKMPEVLRVCIQLFETKPETIFYEAQKIAAMQPPWNEIGKNGKMARNMIKPLDSVWLRCNLLETLD